MKIILILVGIIIIFGVGIIFLPSILGLFAKDIGPVDVSDIEPISISIAAENNAYTDLVKIPSVLYAPKDQRNSIASYASGSQWDEAYIQMLLSKNTTTLSYFKAASEKSSYQNENFSDISKTSPDTVVGPLNEFRIASNISAIQALNLLKQGKIPAAVDESFDIIRVGHHLQLAQATLIEYLVGVALTQRGLTTLQTIVSSSTLSTADLAMINSKLDGYYDTGAGLKNTFKQEGYMLRKGLLDLYVLASDEEAKKILANSENKNSTYLLGHTDNMFYFQPNETKKIFADYTRNQIKRVDLPCAIASDFTEPKLIENTSFPRIIFTKNAIGKILHDVVAVGLNAVTHKRCTANFVVSATKVLVAMKVYVGDTGKYPSSLSELVPKYLSVVPTDPFDEKPIRYSAEKRIIYSVGPKGVDLGGSEDTFFRMENPTIKINFPATKAK